jgi:hypothetical protein
MQRLIAAACFALLATQVNAQTAIVTVNMSAKITTGLTYQQLLPKDDTRKSLTIQNNNTTDNCEIIFGSPFLAADTTATSRTVNGTSLTALQASIVLTPGLSFTRYYPHLPSDIILGTCTTTGDSLYIDIQ